MEILKNSNHKNPIESISFSYNPLLGDKGTIEIANNLPKTIREIGLVGCGISDTGGKELLKKFKEFKNLKMLCMEQNNLTDLVKEEFKKFSENNPQILVVV